MRPITAVIAWIFLVISFSCNNPQAKTSQYSSIKVSTDQAIKKSFPGAVPFEDYADSLLFFLYTVHNIPQEKILLAQSSCVDDVITTKDDISNNHVNGPFNLGGLGGLPFTGITGLNAFAHHVPTGGAALIFVGPHIGYSEKAGWGKIERDGQDEPSSCCGALSKALLDLMENKINKHEPKQEDYQEDVIEQFALEHKDEILTSKAPLITFTHLIAKESARQISNMPMGNAHFKHLIIINGIIINTDKNHPDYIFVDKMSVFDLETERELRTMEPRF